MAVLLPRIDTSARWVGALSCLADDLAEQAGAEAWAEAVAQYVETGEPPDGLPDCDDACFVTLRPLSAAEEDACAAVVGPPVRLAAYIYRRLESEGVDLYDGEALAAALDGLPPDDREAIYRHEQRSEALRLERVCRALVAADYMLEEDASPGDALRALAPDVQTNIAIELAAHLDRLTTLGAAGKAPAGRP